MMSSAVTQRGGRASKERGSKLPQNPVRSSDGTKGSDGLVAKVQPTAEQVRIAQIVHSKCDDPDIKSKIEEITQLTGKTCDEAVVALHDCDNDTNRAVNLLIDGRDGEEFNIPGKWETSSKKKKNRQPAQPKVVEVNGHDPVPSEKEEKEPVENTSRKREPKQREGGYRYRGPPRMNRGGGSGRNWRNKENEKNERNAHDGKRERNSEGRPRGQRRGRGRGGRSRMFQNRGLQNDGFPESIDTWTNSTAEKAEISGSGDNTMTVGNWSDVAVTEDWSEEDWTENLTETKVFTPSNNTQASNVASLDINSAATMGPNIDLASLLQKAKSSSEPSSNSLPANGMAPQSAQGSLMSQQMVPQMSQPVAPQSQSHFDFSQYAKEATEQIKAAVGVGSVQNAQSTPSMNANSFQSSASNYQTNYGVNNSNSQHHVQIPHELQQVMVSQPNYSSGGSTVVPQQSLHLSHDLHSPVASQQPASASSAKPSSTTTQHQPLPQRVKPPKARMPPPSKIPESAVVMPDNAVSSLDVQFGALQFGTDSSPFDFPSTESNNSYQDMNSNSNTSSHVANQSLSSTVSSHTLSNAMPSSGSLTKESAYGLGTHSSVNQNNMTKDLSQSQKVTGQESLLLSQVERKSVDNMPSYVNHRTSQSGNLDGSMMSNKPEQQSAMGSYSSSSHDNSSSYSNVPYGSQKPAVLNTSNLVPSTVSYSHSTSLSAGAAELSSSQQAKYQTQVSQSPSASYVSGSNSYAMQQSGYSASTSSNGNTYPSQTANFNLGYNSSGAYGSNNNAYASQQGYSGSVTSSTPAGTILSTSVSTSKLTNSLSHSVKDSSLLESQHNSAQSSYEVTATTTASSVLTSNSLSSTSTANHNAQSSSNMNTVMGLVSSTSSTSSASVLKNSVSAGKTNIPNIPQSMPTMLSHQYIMGQSLPFYGLQQPVYSYEDMQMLQSKISTMSYYDVQFQPPTSITGRDPGIGSVAYTADGKYSRSDTDASAVVTTLSQGQANTQAHSQAFLNPAAALPPGYGYYFPSGVMAGGIHTYGPPIFPVPPASNTHGATTNTQFQKAAAYGSHSYGSAYDSLTQTQDFAKGTYGAASQSQVKGVSGSGAVADLSASVYSKAHQQLSKSYDKPGFHTGTPPPFNLAGNQAAGPLAPSSAPYAPQFIPVLAHGQHHSTLLHHQMQQDTAQAGGTAAAGHRGPQGLGQQKNSSKQNYYWTGN